MGKNSLSLKLKRMIIFAIAASYTCIATACSDNDNMVGESNNDSLIDHASSAANNVVNEITGNR